MKKLFAKFANAAAKAAWALRTRQCKKTKPCNGLRNINTLKPKASLSCASESTLILTIEIAGLDPTELRFAIVGIGESRGAGG